MKIQILNLVSRKEKCFVALGKRQSDTDSNIPRLR
jgi:hypothetical protein